MLELWSKIVCLLRWMAAVIRNFMIDAVEFVLDVIVGVINAVLSVLPQVEMPAPGHLDAEWIGILNWVFPVGFVVDMLGILIVATLVYKAVHWLVKYAE